MTRGPEKLTCPRAVDIFASRFIQFQDAPLRFVLSEGFESPPRLVMKTARPGR